uniref:Uncharacterized protein n=1 Tax=Physcomitrium patens TaxID=3218 RepID=A0A7I4CND3_PHYPA
MASLRIPTAIAQTNILRHMHKTCTDCSLTSLDQHGIGFAAPSPNLSAIGTPRGRLPIVRAGGCPFGFKNTTGKGSNRESSMETNVTATASSPVDSPYAPSPSADAPDEVNLGPGAQRLRKQTGNFWRCLPTFFHVRFPDRFCRDGGMLFNLTSGEKFNVYDKSLNPLEVMSRVVQEHICLLMNVNGTLRLVSGAVLFPQRWQLLEKMGMDIASIHMSVPLLANEIGSAVYQFFTRLKVGKPVWRANWAIVDDPTLFQSLNEEDIYAAIQGKKRRTFDSTAHRGTVSSQLFTRCERETLMKLPRSGAIVFTIRTYIRPLSVFKIDPFWHSRWCKLWRLFQTPSPDTSQ